MSLYNAFELLSNDTEGQSEHFSALAKILVERIDEREGGEEAALLSLLAAAHAPYTYLYRAIRRRCVRRGIYRGKGKTKSTGGEGCEAAVRDC
jgi:hypothetical protein